MREIKFRVFVKSKNKIFDVYGFNRDKVFIETNDSPEHGVNIFDRDDCVLLQFTGLQDQKGNDVYEGDILENYHNQKFEIVYGLNQKEIVSHNSSQQKRRSLASGFYERQIGQKINSYQSLSSANWGIVIGNIYENPELLK